MKTIIVFLLGCFVLSGCVVYNDKRQTQVKRPPFTYEDWLSSKLCDKGIIPVFGTIDKELAQAVIASMSALEERSDLERITLLINSKGGALEGYLPICNYIQICNKPVDTINTAFCMSAAIPIHQAATGKRLAYQNTFFVYHAVKLFDANKKESEDLADFIKTVQAMYDSDIRANANLPDDWFPLTDRVIMVTAEEAKELGIIDEVITTYTN